MAETQRRLAGRRATDPDLAVVVERLDRQDDLLEEIHTQTKATNGRVAELEIKDRIRKDREEQAAIRSAATEAAKYRVEEQAVEHQHHRIGWRVTLAAVALGSLLSFLGAVTLHALHLV